jgi:hypothetical protein
MDYRIELTDKEITEANILLLHKYLLQLKEQIGLTGFG